MSSGTTFAPLVRHSFWGMGDWLHLHIFIRVVLSAPLELVSPFLSAHFVPQVTQFSHDAGGLLSVQLQHMVQSIEAHAQQAVDVIGLGDAQFVAFAGQVEFQLVGDPGFDFR